MRTGTLPRNGEPPPSPVNLKGADPRNGGAPTQGLAFRFLTRYFFDTGRAFAQLEVVVGRAGLRLLRVGG